MSNEPQPQRSNEQIVREAAKKTFPVQVAEPTTDASEGQASVVGRTAGSNPPTGANLSAPRDAQEWTPEYVSGTLRSVTAICDAHNDVLAAEREKVQRVSGLGADAYNKLKRQLLAAQAAIAEHNKGLLYANKKAYEIKVDLSALDKHDAEVREKAVVDVIGGSIDDAIAEVRKPLVDALERLSRLSLMGKARDIVYDALAKVKEGK